MEPFLVVVICSCLYEELKWWFSSKCQRTYIYATHVSGQSGLVANGRQDMSKKSGYFWTSLGEMENIVNEEEHILALLIIHIHSLVLSWNVDNTICGPHGLAKGGKIAKERKLTSVNVKGNLKLGNTHGCRWDTDKIEITEGHVVTCGHTLILVDLDLDSTVWSSKKNLWLFGGNGRVLWDKLGNDAAKSFNTERETSDIEEKNIGDIPTNHSLLHPVMGNWQAISR